MGQYDTVFKVEILKRGKKEGNRVKGNRRNRLEDIRFCRVGVHYIDTRGPWWHVCTGYMVILYIYILYILILVIRVYNYTILRAYLSQILRRDRVYIYIYTCIYMCIQLQ